MYCRCGSEICPERLEFLQQRGRPLTCVKCSGEQPAVCLVEYGHKTASTVVIVGTDPEQVRLARRAYKRAR